MMPETSAHDRYAERAPHGRAGLGSERYLELFQRLTPLIGSQDRDDICLRACDLIAEMLHVEACSLFLTAAKRTRLRLAAATHIAQTEWAQVELPLDQGVCAEVFNSGKPILIRGEDNFKKQFGRSSTDRYHSASCVIVPLVIRDRVEGVINITNPIGRRLFRQRDRDLLEAAANLIAGALASAMQTGEMRQMHRNLQDVFDSLHVGILSVDNEGHVTQSNQRARMLFGLTESKVIQPELVSILPGTIYNVCRRLMRQSRQDGEPAQDRIKAQLYGGQQIMLEITISRMRCLGGSLSDVLVIFEDVGQDEEVKRLRESESMKRDFLSIISHELRTPLAVIRGALPLIDPNQGREVEGDILSQVHRLLLKNCHRLTEVVNSILDVTEIESGTLQLNIRKVDLHELLDEVIGVHAESAATKQLTWDCRFTIDHPELQADRRRLRQVFSEMVANAIKFSNAGGRISITSSLTMPWLEIEVSNTGARIEPELRKAVFEKFCQGNQTMTRSVGGCGLGLFLVQNIVRLHGGQIELVDRAQDETTFILRLPMAATPGQQATQMMATQTAL